MLGGGLREQAMYSLKVTSNMEPFWKSVLGVEGADANGNAKVLNSDKMQARHDILQVLFIYVRVRMFLCVCVGVVVRVYEVGKKGVGRRKRERLRGGEREQEREDEREKRERMGK